MEVTTVGHQALHAEKIRLVFINFSMVHDMLDPLLLICTVFALY